MSKNNSEKIIIKQTRAVDELKNFESDIEIVEAIYSSNGVELIFDYVWVWDYQPAFTLTDIVIFTWGDEFDSNGRDVGFMYMPSGHRTTLGGLNHDYEDTAYIINTYEGEDAYSGYTDELGYQNKFNIVRSFELDSKTYRVDRHAGLFRVKINRYNLPSDDDGGITVRGGYFHQVLKPDITLELSKEDFGLGVTGELRYDYNEPVVRDFQYW